MQDIKRADKGGYRHGIVFLFKQGKSGDRCPYQYGSNGVYDA